jgi:hypothetical protein
MHHLLSPRTTLAIPLANLTAAQEWCTTETANVLAAQRFATEQGWRPPDPPPEPTDVPWRSRELPGRASAA